MARTVAVAVLLLLFGDVSVVLGGQGQAQPPSRWIIQTTSASTGTSLAGEVRTRWGAPIGARFSSVLNGFAVQLSEAQRRVLAADPRVTAIVPDAPAHAADAPYPPTTDEIQPGLRRVGAMANVDRGSAAVDVDIAVLDTGIQAGNAELLMAGGYNCTDPSHPDAWSDSPNYGHGTHVSGIAAAIQNGRGVAGVAQGARLWSIKVLDSNGNGYWSWIICGLDRVAQMRDPANSAVPRIEVVNMSIAAPGWDDGDCGRSNADLLHQAICRVADAGITMVAAAGNEHRDASTDVPGAYDEVITVAAMADWNGQATSAGSPPTDCTHTDKDDAFASFSNYGADIDLIAPGVCVLSLLPVDRLGRYSGTSMATPHVTGGAALYFLEEKRAGRPRPTPQQVRAALIATGTTDWQTSTDPDRNQPGSVREPALNVSNLSLPASFGIGTKRQIVRAGAGAHVTNGLWVARLGGFTGALNWSVDGPSLPAGSTASVDASPALTINLPANAASGSYAVRVSAARDGETEHATFQLIVPAQTSDAGGPVMSFRIGVQSTQISLPVDVVWAAIPNATRYRVQVSVDEGPWGTTVTSTATRFATAAWPGRRYRYRVQPLVGGVWGAWKVGPSGFVNGLEPSSDLTFTGNWQIVRMKRAYSELPVAASAAGSSASYAFTGRSVAWLADKSPQRGRATVSIDGSVVATVDLQASSKILRVIVFSRSWPTSGPHTIRITVLGTPANRPRVDIDALLITSD